MIGSTTIRRASSSHVHRRLMIGWTMNRWTMKIIATHCVRCRAWCVASTYHALMMIRTIVHQYSIVFELVRHEPRKINWCPTSSHWNVRSLTLSCMSYYADLIIAGQFSCIRINVWNRSWSIGICNVMYAGPAPLLCPWAFATNEVLLRMAGHLCGCPWLNIVSGDAPPISLSIMFKTSQEQPEQLKEMRYKGPYKFDLLIINESMGTRKIAV